ncbi:hypothetical protein NDU88_006807 [Pleurodeles waltl]|uniref:Uncharacterized protein n=1 Tax=Pleurodeles waltl TaxID=8319 RepID=A0AAV7X1R2_PLEWA|nr:hypothetical protein NDU88_006807 [Pleurodeles waltl]
MDLNLVPNVALVKSGSAIVLHVNIVERGLGSQLGAPCCAPQDCHWLRKGPVAEEEAGEHRHAPREDRNRGPGLYPGPPPEAKLGGRPVKTA